MPIRAPRISDVARDKVYPFGYPVCQMLRMGVLRQASHDKVYIKPHLFLCL